MHTCFSSLLNIWREIGVHYVYSIEQWAGENAPGTINKFSINFLSEEIAKIFGKMHNWNCWCSQSDVRCWMMNNTYSLCGISSSWSANATNMCILNISTPSTMATKQLQCLLSIFACFAVRLRIYVDQFVFDCSRLNPSFCG